MIMNRNQELAKTCVEVYTRVNRRYLDACLRAIEEHRPLPAYENVLLDGDVWADVFNVPAPRLTYLAPLLATLPPLVPRAQIGKRYLEGIISAAAVRRDQDRHRGPRIHLKGEGKIGVMYPAPFLIEYLEQRRVKAYVNEQL